MKNNFLVILAIIILSIMTSCNYSKTDNLYCGGMCPHNQICLTGNCICPEGKILDQNNYCIPISDTLSVPNNPVYLSSNSSCLYSNYNISFPFFNPDLKNIVHGDPLFFDSNVLISINGNSDPLVGFRTVAVYLSNDGHVHALIKNEHFQGTCGTPSNQNYCTIDAKFSINYDTLSLSYYYQCGSGERDTCYETKLLQK